MERAMTNEWEVREGKLAAKRRAIWIWTPVFGIVGVLAIVGGVISTGAMHWIGLVFGGLMTSWALVYGTAVYMRTIDEQEREANLWGCYVGMCVYLALFGLKILLDWGGTTVPQADNAIFLIVMLTVLSVFSWRRFR